MKFYTKFNWNYVQTKVYIVGKNLYNYGELYNNCNLIINCGIWNRTFVSENINKYLNFELAAVVAILSSTI